MINLALCSTICGTETRLQDQFHFLGRCSTFLRRCSINCGTVPQKVELFHFVSVFLDTAQYSIWYFYARPRKIDRNFDHLIKVSDLVRERPRVPVKLTLFSANSKFKMCCTLRLKQNIWLGENSKSYSKQFSMAPGRTNSPAWYHPGPR